MDMNPFKPLIQHCEEFYGKILFIKEPLKNFYLKPRLSKANANTWKLCTESTKQQLLQAWLYPLACSLVFQQSLLIDFANVCNDSTYSSTTKEEIMVRIRWVYWWDFVWSLRSLLINRPTPSSSSRNTPETFALYDNTATYQPIRFL